MKFFIAEVSGSEKGFWPLKVSSHGFELELESE